MATSNADRVGRALQLLSAGLAPFVDRALRQVHGDDWVRTVAANHPRGPDQAASATDVQFLLWAMVNQWQPVFRRVLGHSERSQVGELIEVRNRWAHQDPFSTDDAYRALDTTHRLLQAISAPQAAEADRAKQELLRVRFAEQARQETRRISTAAVEGRPAAGLRPWREVVTPHRDVASGRYQQAEFAADLAQVHRGDALAEYADPTEFYRRTFLTEGLHRLLVRAAERLAGTGGDPVVALQTNFGGGKTHSLLALYHLVAATSATDLPGIEPVLEAAGVAKPPTARRAVLVGTAISPSLPQHKADGTQVRTLWGELAWQLGGPDGYALVADADATGTSPGSTVLAGLLARSQPCLILIDEWVAYARNLYGVPGLPAGSFDAHFTFAQALTEAVRATPGALLVVSLPASDIEKGGEGGEAALERLANVVGRLESTWRPASAEEGFEIVRRRLFEPITDPDRFRARDAVVRAFADLYRAQSGEFPRGCGEGDYARRLQAAYPIHPLLFDFLYGQWSTLDKFQRTRGVLRLMASVIHELWERADPNLLLLPASVPLDASTRVQTELTQYLEDRWVPIIEGDIDGPNSTPLAIDRQNASNLGRFSATRRVARTIFLGSAPTHRAPNRGIDDATVKLGSVQPGEAPATFGDALRRLAEQATYLYVDKGRYWYSTQPSVAQIARDRAERQVRDDDVAAELARRLRADRARGDFVAVHAAPESTADVTDEPEARLVILGPAHPHTARTDDSPARSWAAEVLERRGNAPRRHRNTLLFLAPDRARLAELGAAIRQYLAWKSIHDDADRLNLDPFQRNQAATRRDQADDTVDQRIPETYQWILAPRQPDPTGPIVWDELRVTGGGDLAGRVSRKLVTEEALITAFSGVRLRLELDRVPLWRGDHVELRQLWADLTQYLYLPRLRDVDVLLDAVRDGVGQLTWEDTFAYAQGYEADAGRYLGLRAGDQGGGIVADSRSLLVQPEAARRQFDQQRAAVTAADGAGAGSGATYRREAPIAVPEPEESTRLAKRFYATVRLDPERVARDVQQVTENVVAHLQALVGAQVELILEISANTPEGVPEHVERTVTENARTLKFDDFGFEEG